MRPILIIRKNILLITFFMAIMIIVDGMFEDKILFKFISLSFLFLSMMCFSKKFFVKIDNIFNPINEFIYKKNKTMFMRKKIISIICFLLSSIIMFVISEIINSNHFFIAKSMYFFIFLIILVSFINFLQTFLFKIIKNIKYSSLTSSMFTIISLIAFVIMINYYTSTNLSFDDLKLFNIFI